MHQPIQVVEGFKDSVMSVRCGFDEIVTGCVDGAVRVHDLRTGQCRIDELGSLQFPLAGGVIGIEGKRGGSDGGAEEGVEGRLVDLVRAVLEHIARLYRRIRNSYEIISERNETRNVLVRTRIFSRNYLKFIELLKKTFGFPK